MLAVGILLYRKHVITEQPYIAQLIECMEQYGLRPLPIFINGVEAHTVVRPGWWRGRRELVQRCRFPPQSPGAGLRGACKLTPSPRGWLQVRDQLTTTHEQQLLREGQATSPTLSRDAVMVDAIVNTGKERAVGMGREPTAADLAPGPAVSCPADPPLAAAQFQSCARLYASLTRAPIEPNCSGIPPGRRPRRNHGRGPPGRSGQGDPGRQERAVSCSLCPVHCVAPANVPQSD